jgi:hypothetical protein
MSDQNPPSILQDPNSNQNTAWVEATPILREMHHKETIPCYTLLPGNTGAQVSKPKIELPRGAQILVDGKKPVVLGSQTYLQIVSCVLKPDSVGHYIRQEEVIPVPEGAAPQPVQALGKLNLRRVKRANKAGKPIMEMAGVQVPPGAILSVSRVHRVTQADHGDGVIDADGKKDYRLVVGCEQVPNAVGLFVQADAISAF